MLEEKWNKLLDNILVILIVSGIAFVLAYMIGCGIAAADPGGIEAWRVGLIAGLSAIACTAGFGLLLCFIEW